MRSAAWTPLLILLAQLNPAPAQESATGAEPRLLRYHFEPGAVLFLRVEHLSIMERLSNGPPEAMRARREAFMRWKVLEAAADKAVIEWELDRVKLVASQPGRAPFEYDSAAPKASAGSRPPFAAMLHHPLRVTLSNRGEVLGVKDPKKTGGLSQEIRDQLASDFAQMLPLLPEQAVATGSAWNYERTLQNEAMGAVRMSVVCRLEALEGGIAHIELSLRIRPGAGAEAGGIIPRKSGGTALFSLSTGMVRSVATSVKLEIRAPAPDAPQMSGTLRMKLEQVAPWKVEQGR